MIGDPTWGDDEGIINSIDIAIQDMDKRRATLEYETRTGRSPYETEIELQSEASWLDFLRSQSSAGFIEKHYAEARIEDFDELGGDDFKDIDDVMRETASYLVARKNPLEAVLFMLGRASSKSHDKWVIEKTKHIEIAARHRADFFIGFEFDPQDFVNAINQFETRVAKCFSSKKLWKLINEAIMEESLVKTTIEDTFRNITIGSDKSTEEDERATVAGKVAFKRISRIIHKSLNSLITLTNKLIETQKIDVRSRQRNIEYEAERYLLGEVGSEENKFKNIVNLLTRLNGRVVSDRRSIERVRSSLEYAGMLTEYLGILDDVYNKTNALRNMLESTTSSHYINVLNNVNLISASLVMLSDYIVKSRMYMERSMNRPSGTDYDFIAESTLDNIIKGDYSRYKNKFFDFDLKPEGIFFGIDSQRYIHYGFSDKIISKLIELGLINKTASKELENIGDIILAGAEERAGEAFLGFVDSHFSTLADWR